MRRNSIGQIASPASGLAAAMASAADAAGQTAAAQWNPQRVDDASDWARYGMTPPGSSAAPAPAPAAAPTAAPAPPPPAVHAPPAVTPAVLQAMQAAQAPPHPKAKHESWAPVGGAVVGGVLGLAAGALLWRSHRGVGALIGGVLGPAVGYGIGSLFSGGKS